MGVATGLLAVGVPVAVAAGEPVAKMVTAEIVIKKGTKPGEPGKCSAVTFAQWKKVPGTQSARVSYAFDGREYSKSGSPPFDNEFELVVAYRAPSGYDWINLGKSWVLGTAPNNCSKQATYAEERYAPKATVELILTPGPTIGGVVSEALSTQGESLVIGRAVDEALMPAQAGGAEQKPLLIGRAVAEALKSVKGGGAEQRSLLIGKAVGEALKSLKAGGAEPRPLWIGAAVAEALKSVKGGGEEQRSLLIGKAVGEALKSLKAGGAEPRPSWIGAAVAEALKSVKAGGPEQKSVLIGKAVAEALKTAGANP